LSKGKLIGDNLQCGYHGIEFDHDGRSIKVPSGGQRTRKTLRAQLSALRAAGGIRTRASKLG
jgi:phenylpropionate dioxygenase-like ring-hydroxylating dioxygenase large terminal subunit